jgi:hypothetical protein
VLNDVVLNQVLVSFGDGEKTARVIDAIQAEGTCWCGGTVWEERKAMRISVSSCATSGRLPLQGVGGDVGLSDSQKGFQAAGYVGVSGDG